jgi:hypothetical protein
MDKSARGTGRCALDDLDRLKLMREARFRFGIRLVMSCVFLLVGLFFWYLSHSEVLFFFRGGDAVVDLGDLRRTDFDSSVLDGLDTNDQVSFRNDIVMFNDLKTESHRLYYSPLTNFVVMTPRELPKKDYEYNMQRIYEIDSWEESLLLAKKVFPEDLKVSFDAGGRVIAWKDAWDWVRPALEYMANSSGVPKEKLLLVLDGERPESKAYKMYFTMFVVSVVVALGSLVLLVFSVFRYRRQVQIIRSDAAQAGN